MYGTHISTLSVYVRSGSRDTLLWSKAGTHGDKWLQAVVTVNSRTNFQVRLTIFGKKKNLKKNDLHGLAVSRNRPWKQRKRSHNMPVQFSHRPLTVTP